MPSPTRSATTFPPWERRRRDADVQSTSETDIHGNRVETRHLTALTSLRGYLKWPGIAQVVRIERTREIAGKVSRDLAYAITSLPPERCSAKRLLALDREHWGIENRLHWVRDVTLGEDACRVRSGHAPRVYAVVRNLVLGIVRNLYPGSRHNLAAIQRDLSWSPDLIQSLLTIPPLVEN